MTNKTKLTAEMVRKGEHQELYEEYAKRNHRTTKTISLNVN